MGAVEQDEKMPKMDNCRDEGRTNREEPCEDLGDAEKYQNGDLKNCELGDLSKNINEDQSTQSDPTKEADKVSETKVCLYFIILRIEICFFKKEYILIPVYDSSGVCIGNYGYIGDKEAEVSII